jgi:hypothetical protein
VELTVFMIVHGGIENVECVGGGGVQRTKEQTGLRERIEDY